MTDHISINVNKNTLKISTYLVEQEIRIYCQQSENPVILVSS